LRALVGAFKAVKLSSRRTLVSAAVYGEKHLRAFAGFGGEPARALMDAVAAMEEFSCS
jgi:hypothetical protein